MRSKDGSSHPGPHLPINRGGNYRGLTKRDRGRWKKSSSSTVSSTRRSDFFPHRPITSPISCFLEFHENRWSRLENHPLARVQSLFERSRSRVFPKRTLLARWVLDVCKADGTNNGWTAAACKSLAEQRRLLRADTGDFNVARSSLPFNFSPARRATRSKIEAIYNPTEQ